MRSANGNKINSFFDKSKILILQRDLLRAIYKYYQNAVERNRWHFFPEGYLHIGMKCSVINGHKIICKYFKNKY